MDAELSELFAGGEPREQLMEVLADLAKRPVPTGAVHRLWSVSDLSAQIAIAYFVWWVRQWFEGAGEREQRLMETNLAVAVKIVHRLGYLRGALTKLGQAAGNLPHVLPDEVISTIDRLHFDAPPMHYSLIREVLRDELGGEPEDVFASFEQQAFAAASLGQVHRARLKSGEEVAVKIQYPGIARTIDADFRNLSALLFPFRFTKGWEGQKAIFEEIRRMLHQEVDYVQEADALRRARDLFRDEDGIVIPRVYPEHSTGRVLTTDYLRGVHLDAFLAANPEQALRNEFGTKMYRAWFRLYYAYMNYGDPHQGNYIFMDDGRLGLIDFGCVQNYNAEERELARLDDALTEDNPAALRSFVKKCGELADDDPDLDAYIRVCSDCLRWLLEPIRRPGPFDFGDESHFARGIEWFSQMTRERIVGRWHPMWVYWNRSIFGLRGLLCRLRAQVDVGAVMADEREIRDRRG